MGEVVLLLLISWFGIRVVGKKLARLILVDLASLPGPPGFLGRPWIQVHGGSVSGADIAAWPYSVGVLFRFTSFLHTSHWPAGSDDMGHFGVSFLQLFPF